VTSHLYSYDYSYDYDPAFPSVDVSVSVPQTPENLVRLSVLLDSGADGTLLPVDYLDSIGATPIDQVRIRGVFGDTRVVDLYLVDLRIGPYHLRSVEIGATESGGEALIGRNVLNQMEVTLNGPAGVVEVK
jgi:predicted aspartyl protease